MALQGRTIGGLGIGGAAVVLAGFLITAFEGRVNHQYPDPVTYSTPWTYCDGETTPKHDPSKVYSDAECDAITSAKVLALDGLVMSCIGHPLPDDGKVPVKVRAAFDSLAWNIGGHGFCTSTLAAKAKAGDLRGACNEIPRWDKAGGKTIPGLTFRRGQEYSVCLDGLDGE